MDSPSSGRRLLRMARKGTATIGLLTLLVVPLAALQPGPASASKAHTTAPQQQLAQPAPGSEAQPTITATAPPASTPAAPPAGDPHRGHHHAGAPAGAASTTAAGSSQTTTAGGGQPTQPPAAKSSDHSHPAGPSADHKSRPSQEGSHGGHAGAGHATTASGHEAARGGRQSKPAAAGGDPPSRPNGEGTQRPVRERQRRLTEREQRRRAREGVAQSAPPRPVLASTPAQPAAPPATGATAATSAATPSASTPAAAATGPKLGTGASGVGTAAQKASPGARSRTHKHGSAALAGAPRSAVTALAPAAGAAALTASATSPARHRGDASDGAPRGRPRHHGGESPIVTTVTKIIGVVPSLVRVVIAALVLLALALAVHSRVGAIRTRRLARQRRELLDDVGLLQAALLPTLPDRLGPVGTTAAYRPASGPGAGGDFFDVFALADGQVGVIVGDVSGHGREALPHTTLVRYTLRAYLEAGLSPRGALQTAAPVLERQLGSSFATVVLATYNPRERMLVYASAGHPPPLVTGTESIVPITACSAPPIGIGRTTGTRQTTVSIPGEAVVCFYTDGVVESRVQGELFGTERLARVLDQLGTGATAASLLDTVAEQCDQRADDMAACLLHIEGAPAAPSVEWEELEVDRGEAERGRPERFLQAGGLAPGESAALMREVRSAAARHGRVVLELQRGDGAPEVHLHPQNIAVFQPPLRDAAAAARVSR